MFERARSKLALDAALADGATDGASASNAAPPAGEPTSSEMSAVLRKGAYAVLKEDPAASEAASAAFEKATIDELLARGTRINLGSNPPQEHADLTLAPLPAASSCGVEAGANGDATAEGGDKMEEEVDDDRAFWRKVAKRAAANEEALGRGVRRAVGRSTLADVECSDLSASDDGGDSDGYVSLVL